MQFLNLAGYKFLPLEDLAAHQQNLAMVCHKLACKGTILLSHEGININVVGQANAMANFVNHLQQDEKFSDITFRRSYSASAPFKRMKVKIKPEIITLRQPNIRPELQRAPAILPEQLKQWLDEKRDITLLDTRNAYEVQFGTFANATHLPIQDFSEFPQHLAGISPTKPVVMFCTGGIRCEKAALHMQATGFSEVYQLDGGILNYFAKTNGEHFEGECFVFDERIAVDAQLRETATRQCQRCEGPLSSAQTTDLYCQRCLV